MIESRTLAGLALGISLLLPTTGSTEERSQVIRDLDRALINHPLPPMHEIAPGYRPVSIPPPGVAIGIFSTSSQDEVDWGLVVSALLRDQVAHAPRTAVHVPTGLGEISAEAHGLANDHDGLLRSPERLRRVAGRHGISAAVQGIVRITQQHETRFEIATEWHDYATGSVTPLETLRVPPQSLGEAINQLAAAVWTRITPSASFVASPSREAPHPIEYEQIKYLAQLVRASKAPDSARIKSNARALLDSAPGLPTAIYTWAGSGLLPAEAAARNRALSDVARLYPDHSGIQVVMARHWQSDGQARRRIQLQWARAIVADDPSSLPAQALLGAMLRSSNDELAALTMAREMVTHWPDDFRSWESLAEAVLLASGNGVYSSEESAEYGSMVSIADRVIDQALALHADSADLWWIKMRANPRYDDAMVAAFRSATRIDPGYRLAYESAYEYSAPDHGGEIVMQEKVRQLAIANNPEAEWPQMLGAPEVKHDTDFTASEDGPQPVAASDQQDDGLDSDLTRIGELLAGIPYVLVLIVVAIVVLIARSRSEEQMPTYRPKPRDRAEARSREAW